MFKWLIVLLLLLFVYHVREVFPPFIVGAIIAYLLYPLVKFLNQRCGFAPFWSVLLIYFATGTVVGFLAWHFWPVLVDEATNLFEQRREIVTNLVDQVRQQFSLQLDVHETSDIILNQLQNSIGKPEEIVHFGGVVSKSLLSILVCAVTSVYMLADNKRVGRFFMRFVAPEKRATVVSLAGQMDVMFRKYVLGQLGLITLMSVIAFFILTCCGIKYALLIALVTGFLEIIPVLGPLLAIIIASVFSVAQLGIGHFWIVPLWYWIARLLEDYVIVPNTIGHAVELHPLAVIFAVVVGETMAGALGMLIAIPVAASIKVVIDFCYPPTTMAVPSEHTNPLDKFFKTIMPPPKQHSPEAEKLHSDIETISAMHEGAQGMAPRHLIEKSSVDRNVIDTSSGAKNPISGELPHEPKSTSQPAAAAHSIETPTATRQSDAPKQTASQVKNDNAPDQPAPPVATLNETFTGMAARIKTDEKKETDSQEDQQSKRNDSFTQLSKEGARKAKEKAEIKPQSAPETKSVKVQSETKGNSKTIDEKSPAPSAKPQEKSNQAAETAMSETTAEPATKAAEANPKPATSAKKEEEPKAKNPEKKD